MDSHALRSKSNPVTGMSRERLVRDLRVQSPPLSALQFQSYLPHVLTEEISQPVIPLSGGVRCVLLFFVTFVYDLLICLL